MTNGASAYDSVAAQAAVELCGLVVFLVMISGAFAHAAWIPLEGRKNTATAKQRVYREQGILYTGFLVVGSFGAYVCTLAWMVQRGFDGMMWRVILLAIGVTLWRAGLVVTVPDNFLAVFSRKSLSLTKRHTSGIGAGVGYSELRGPVRHMINIFHWRVVEWDFSTTQLLPQQGPPGNSLSTKRDLLWRSRDTGDIPRKVGVLADTHRRTHILPLRDILQLDLPSFEVTTSEGVSHQLALFLQLCWKFSCVEDLLTWANGDHELGFKLEQELVGRARQIAKRYAFHELAAAAEKGEFSPKQFEGIADSVYMVADVRVTEGPRLPLVLQDAANRGVLLKAQRSAKKNRIRDELLDFAELWRASCPRLITEDYSQVEISEAAFLAFWKTRGAAIARTYD
jgi:hypothetical protein